MDIKIPLCEKCFENGDYINPICFINIKEKNKYEYVCIRDNNNTIKNIELNDDMKKKISFCEKHKEKRLCAFCKDCKRNLCFLCITQEKHNYKLYNKIYPSIGIIEKFKDIIKEFLYLRIYCILYSCNLDDITNIINTYELYYKLIIEEKILNYQILNTFIKLIEIYPKIIDEFKTLVSNEITKQYTINKLNEQYQANIITFPVKEMNDRIESIYYISLELSNYKNNILIEKSKKPFILYPRFKYILQLYDENGIMINELSLIDNIYDICDISQYEPNLLMLYCRLKFSFLFLHISSNMLEYKFSKIFFFEFGCTPEKLSVIAKLNNKYFSIFCNNNYYYIYFDKKKIFKQDLPLMNKANNYFDIVSTKDLIGSNVENIFVISYKNNKNNIEIIGISILIEFTIKRDDGLEYKHFIDVSNSFSVFDISTKFNTFLSRCHFKEYNSEYKYVISKAKIKFYITIFDSNIPIIKNKVEIFCPSDNYIFFEGKLKDTKLTLDRFGDYLLLFLFEHAYHIDLKAGEIIAIYEFNYKKIVDEFGDYE